MIHVVEMASHILWVDENKQRIYCTMTGQDELPDTAALVQEWSVAMGLVRCGCTVLLDMSQIQEFTIGFIGRLSWIRKMLRETKRARIAEIFAPHLARSIKTSEQRNVFTCREEAETWLDEVVSTGLPWWKAKHEIQERTYHHQDDLSTRRWHDVPDIRERSGHIHPPF